MAEARRHQSDMKIEEEIAKIDNLAIAQQYANQICPPPNQDVNDYGREIE